MSEQQTQAFTRVEQLSLHPVTHDLRVILGRILERLAELEVTPQSEQNIARFPLYIRFDGQFLYVQNVCVPLHSRPLSCKLIQTFFQANRTELSRTKLMELVYDNAENGTPRLRKCAELNLNKLISRTRRLIEDALSGTCWAKQLEWLVFDTEAKKWELYALRHSPIKLLNESDSLILGNRLFENEEIKASSDL